MKLFGHNNPRGKAAGLRRILVSRLEISADDSMTSLVHIMVNVEIKTMFIDFYVKYCNIHML